ncbi:60S ribosomal protein L28 [Tetranychus urticae]|uniref:Large ribosomal subunit protein eL28 n=1 Tax=Tetranychus urticae TaxID=32264 RepID=T1JS63_TETUR|nr:60S ribosomal protein L28 [Tetranychus urticae]
MSGRNTGVNVSRDLLWLFTKNHNCNIYKQKGIKVPFTKDPLNPKGVQTLRWSGSIQRKTLSVTPHPKGKGVVLVYRKRKYQMMPKKALQRVPLLKDNRRSYRSIKKFVNRNFYRTDLKMTVLRKASAILRSQQPRIHRKRNKRAKKAE